MSNVNFFRHPECIKDDIELQGSKCLKQAAIYQGDLDKELLLEAICPEYKDIMLRQLECLQNYETEPERSSCFCRRQEAIQTNMNYMKTEEPSIYDFLQTNL